MRGASSSSSDPAIGALVTGTSDDPFALLGRHQVESGGQASLVFRTLQPGASSVELIVGGNAYPMQRVHSDLFETIVPLGSGISPSPAYRYRVQDGRHTREIHDPYQFGQLLADFDLHLFAEGTHYRAWE